MLIVGSTGGIATGKSTVSRRLREYHHLPIVDADIIAREVVNPGTSAYNAIVDYFGGITPHLIKDDGSGELNRPALGRTVFGNEEHRRKLNSIVHPAVRKAMAWEVLKRWVRGYAVVVVDVPLLFESKLDPYVGLSVAVICDEAAEYKRLRSRDPDLTENDARQRIASQMPSEEKRDRADVVIDNDSSIESLNDNVDWFVAEYLRPPWYKTALQWIFPIGISWALYDYYSRSKRLNLEIKNR